MLLPTPQKFALLGAAALLGLIAMLGFLRVRREFPANWATVIPTRSASESQQIDIEAALATSGDSEGPQPGAIVPLARFYQSNGNVVTLLMVEGQFYDTAIEPRNVWKGLGRNVMLVSSVDENRSAAGPSSGPIAVGCSVPRSQIPLQLGQAAVTQCNGAYRQGGHVSWVASVAPVVWTSESPDKRPCWERYGIDASNGYQDCVSNSVADALKDLFLQIRNNPDRQVDALVLPAIGTGVGGLSKAGFYHTLLKTVLVEELKQGYDLPSALYLHVRRWESPNRWAETRKALAASVSESVTTWVYKTEHKSTDSEWLSLTGVAAGSCIILLLLFFGIDIPLLRADLVLLTGPRALINILIWAATAVGLVSMLKSVMLLFPTTLNPYLQITSGLIAAPFCGSLLKAKRAFEDSLVPIPGDTDVKREVKKHEKKRH